MLVDILLLSASGRMLGFHLSSLRILLGGILGAALTGLMWFPGLDFLSHILWRIIVLIVTALVTMGFRREVLPAILLFLLLHLSLGNLTGTGDEMFSTFLGAAGIALACILVKNRRQLVEVSLTYAGKTFCFSALRDTGNELRDPVTGEPVLVVGEQVARELTGLTEQALADPIKSISLIPGLRLIPYQTVGNTGFLLAMRIQEARVGNRQGSVLVAFSPNKLGRNYQALTGGMMG